MTRPILDEPESPLQRPPVKMWQAGLWSLLVIVLIAAGRIGAVLWMRQLYFAQVNDGLISVLNGLCIGVPIVIAILLYKHFLFGVYFLDANSMAGMVRVLHTIAMMPAMPIVAIIGYKGFSQQPQTSNFMEEVLACVFAYGLTWILAHPKIRENKINTVWVIGLFLTIIIIYYRYLGLFP